MLPYSSIYFRVPKGNVYPIILLKGMFILLFYYPIYVRVPKKKVCPIIQISYLLSELC